MVVGSDRLSPQPARVILALSFPFPIGPFLPSLSSVLAPFFITPSLSSHIWFSIRHHSRIFIGVTDLCPSQLLCPILDFLPTISRAKVIPVLRSKKGRIGQPD